MKKNTVNVHTVTWLNLTDVRSVKEARHREHTGSVHTTFENAHNPSWVTEVRVVIASGRWGC